MRAAVITRPGGVDGVTDPRVFISDRLPLAAFPDAIARFQAGIGRKIQIQPGLATA